MLGFLLADPIVGLIISAAIIVLLWSTVRSIGRRLMDGIEPELVDEAEHALEHTPGVLAVTRLQLRWVGHRRQGTAIVQVAASSTLAEAEAITHEAEHELGHALPNLDDMLIRTATAASPASAPHTH